MCPRGRRGAVVAIPLPLSDPWRLRPAAWDRPPLHMNDHFVTFYDDRASLAREVGEFIGAGLRAGDAGIVIARGDLREQLAGLEDGSGEDAARGPFFAHDAAQTLSRFMAGERLNALAFAATVGGILARARAAGNGRVRVFGEMVGLLAERRQGEASIRLERLWNELARRCAFTLLCGYAIRPLCATEAGGTSLLRICAAHSRVNLPPDLWETDCLRAAPGLMKW